MLEFDPEKATKEDIVYLFFNSKGIQISEDFYKYVDTKKVRDAAIKQDYIDMLNDSGGKMDLYDDLAYRYNVSIKHIRNIVGKISEKKLVHSFLLGNGIEIPEEFYNFIDSKKVRDSAIKNNFIDLIDSKGDKMEVYGELAEKYSMMPNNIARIVDKD